MNKVFEFKKDIGLHVDLYGMFIATEEEVEDCIGKELHLDLDIEEDEIYNERKFNNVVITEDDIIELSFKRLEVSYNEQDGMTEYFSRFVVSMEGLFTTMMYGGDENDCVDKETYRLYTPYSCDEYDSKSKTLEGFNPIKKLKEQS